MAMPALPSPNDVENVLRNASEITHFITSLLRITVRDIVLYTFTILVSISTIFFAMAAVHERTKSIRCTL